MDVLISVDLNQNLAFGVKGEDVEIKPSPHNQNVHPSPDQRVLRISNQIQSIKPFLQVMRAVLDDHSRNLLWRSFSVDVMCADERCLGVVDLLSQTSHVQKALIVGEEHGFAEALGADHRGILF